MTIDACLNKERKKDKERNTDKEKKEGIKTVRTATIYEKKSIVKLNK